MAKRACQVKARAGSGSDQFVTERQYSVILNHPFDHVVNMADYTHIRCTPAMEAGVTTSPWTVRELVDMIEP